MSRRLVLCLALAACVPAAPAPTTGGDAERGRLLLRQYGCGGCHTIPGVAAARGNTGPPLGDMSRRVYVGGVLPNTPDNLVRWIQSPQSIDPRTLMPDMQVSETHARDMTAYLYHRR